MAMTPKRLYGPALPATGPATVYTVPASTKTIIRQIHISNPTASAITLTISIGADAAATRLYGAYSIPANSDPNSVKDFFEYWVMTAAEILQIAVSSANLNVTIFGDEYTL